MYNKIDSRLSFETLVMLCRDLRKQGKIVGFTHGAFDLFHIGHLHLLTEARKQCDFIIVGLESDKNITQYKDIIRPIINEEGRFSIVNGLACVSAVFINHNPLEDQTYDHYYSELSPSKIFIGRNYGFEERITERSLRHGIAIEKIDTDLESTSKIIQRIVKRSYNGVHSRKLSGGNN